MADRLRAFEAILRRIKHNNIDDLDLSHREVRAYAASLLALGESEDIQSLGFYHRYDEFVLLLACLAAPGLNHRHRSFIAGEILSILEEGRSEQKDQAEGNSDGIPF